MPAPGPRPEGRRGIRLRFLLAMAAFVVVSMALLGLALYLGQRQIMLERLAEDEQDLAAALQEKASAYAAFLARISPQGMLGHDYLLLEGYAEELAADPDVVYAVIFDASGRALTHSLRASDGGWVPPERYARALEEARLRQDLLVARRAIVQDQVELGSVEVGLSRAKLVRKLEAAQERLDRDLRRVAWAAGVAIALSLVVLIVLVEAVFSRMIVAPIRALGAAMARVPAGDLGARAPVLREDELGWLARCFNQTAAALEEQLARLEAQRRTEQETRDYLASILDHSGDMIVTTAEDGGIVEFNRAAQRTLGYGRGEVVGRPARLIYCDASGQDRLYAAVRGGATVQDAERRLRRKDGTVIDAQLTLSPLEDNAGRIVGTVCIGRDVTQAKALRGQLIQAERLASVGQVASWIAHQIRNYLGRVLMDAAALRPGEAAADADRRAYRDLSDAVQSMDRLVTDLLDYSRTLRLHLAPLKVNACLDGLLAPLATHPRLTIVRVYDPDLPTVQADVFKLEQALTNILSNALEAMPEGGTLTVTTRRDAGQVAVVVRDTGPGIAAADLPRVLQPFYTTKPSGTGLGLAMAARIVEAHEGRIEVRSPGAGGAELTVTLPVGEPGAPAP